MGACGAEEAGGKQFVGRFLYLLRHSFATHVLEDGVDLRYMYIQERYTHVNKRALGRVRSPLDG